MKGSVKTPVAKAAAAKDILGCLITMPYKVNEVYKAVPFNANVPRGGVNISHPIYPVSAPP